MKTVLASLFACAVLAHSAQLLAQAPAPEVAAPKAAPSVTVPPSEGTEPAKGSAAEGTPQPAAPPGGTLQGAEPSAAAEPVGEPVDDTATAPIDEAPAPEKHDVGASRLESELHKVEADRANYSRLLPYLTVGVGAALTVGATGVGVAHVLSCDGDCSTSAWIGIAVVTGTFIATVGAIWLVHANADVRELDSKHYQLEQELERIKFSANLPNKSDLNRSQMFTWRVAFR